METTYLKFREFLRFGNYKAAEAWLIVHPELDNNRTRRMIKTARNINKRKSKTRYAYTMPSAFREYVAKDACEHCGAIHALEMDHILTHRCVGNTVKGEAAAIIAFAKSTFGVRYSSLKAFLKSEENGQTLCTLCNSKKRQRETKTVAGQWVERLAMELKFTQDAEENEEYAAAAMEIAQRRDAAKVRRDMIDCADRLARFIRSTPTMRARRDAIAKRAHNAYSRDKMAARRKGIASNAIPHKAQYRANWRAANAAANAVLGRD